MEYEKLLRMKWMNEKNLVSIDEKRFWALKNASGYYSGPVRPSTAVGAPLTLLRVKVVGF